ncbi:MAG: pantetheine-phosphate adenylyltransferase [Thermomicrobiales bacterium]|jgi:pantetheine-phosphate adenylyltransferase|nr:pantetheine-phosphate adenylyltransferase [Thermomicrobiales bacterium]
MNPRRAIYPGSFDPVTLGHVDVARRAARLFDEVVVAVYEGQEKPGAFFSPQERMDLVRAVVAEAPETNIVVDSFSGLTVDYARSRDAGVIVRGLRAVSDFEYEFKLAHMNAHLAPGIEVVCLMTSSGHSFISSSLIREVAALGGDIDGLVPAIVGDALRAKLAARA